mmetsp:Transcript_75/g.201  ORF Transcript_75/g.201 Transcript_75/m.201 type:complete len:264 (-) Transcript_75:177-968(-)
MTTIRYFIPEDGDEELHPNVFLAPKPRQPGAPPTLQAVRDAFPLPGHYHFRFKSPLFPGADREKGAMAVWMDVTKDAQPVPTWKNGIIAKVTRLSMEEDDDDDEDDFRRGHNVGTPASSAPVPARAPPSHASSNVSTGSGDHLDMLFDSGSHGPSPASGNAPAPNLFDSHPPSAPASGGSLLDFGASPPSSGSAVHNDFLGMSAPPQHPPHGGNYPPPQQPQPPPPQQQPMYQQQQQQKPPGGQSFNSFAKQAQPFGDLGGWT